MGSRAGCVSIEWATEGVLESLALSDSRVAAGVALVSERRGRACAHAFAWLLVSGAREYPQAPLDVAERETPERGGFRRVLSSVVQGRVCGVRAAAVLAHTVSLGVGMLRGLLERAKLLFSIVDLMSVNGAAFRQLRVACETTQEFLLGLRYSAHTVQSPPLQAGSCQVCRSMKGEGDRELGEIRESEC
eukprot:scaffold15055_cov121-Isochrysis_galbana.AAC.4